VFDGLMSRVTLEPSTHSPAIKFWCAPMLCP
jgi:hypothetical protein